MSFSRWIAMVPSVSCLSIFDSTRTSKVKVKPGLFSFSIRESVRNVWLHARENHLCYALSIKRRISDMETIIMPWIIRIVLPYVLPLSRVEIPEAPPLRQVLGPHWSNRTEIRLWLEEANRELSLTKLKGWKLGKDQECWGHSKVVRDMGRKLHQLL